jgi:hypothetical protein
MMPVVVDFYISDVCNGSGFGEGKFYLGNVSDTTDANGTSSTANMGMSLDFLLQSSWMAMSGWFVTATVTEVDMTNPMNPLLNTSQFSACFTATLPGQINPGLGGQVQPVQVTDPVQPTSFQPTQFGNFLQLTNAQLVGPASFVAATDDQPASGSGQTVAPDQHARDWVFAHLSKSKDVALSGADALLESALSGTLL